MASVSQVIPNYVQGMSMQPDQLKVPGQLKDLVNAYPDVTRGCMKRLGSKKIAELGAPPEGTWFSIDRGRDPTDQYIGVIGNGRNLVQPVIQIWNMQGQEQQVYYSPEPYDNPTKKGRPQLLNYPPANSTYLVAKPNPLFDINSDRQQYSEYHDLKVFNGDGKVFILNDQVTPKLTADEIKDDAKYHEAFLSLRQVQYQRDYLLAFDDPMKNDAEENVSWEYAKGVSDVKFLPRDPNITLAEEDVGIVCDLAMGYQTADLSANKLGEGGKIRLVSSSNPDGEDLKISLEVVCVTQQKVWRNHNNDPAQTEYYWQADYTPRLQLMNGGKNWKDGDVLVIEYQADNTVSPQWGEWSMSGNWVQMTFKIGGSGTQTIQADIGYISVKTDKSSADETIPFASANDIINGLCFALEQAGGIPLKYDSEGDEEAGAGLFSEPDTVSVSWGGSGDERVSNDVNGPEDDKKAFLDGMNIEFKAIGNGIYMRRKAGKGEEKSFNLVTPEEQLFNHMSTKKNGEWYSPVNSVTRLPNQCRHGYVALIANSDSENDDFYLKFEGNTDSDGEGVWKETFKPGYNVGPVSSTMPHEIIRLQDGAFVVTPIFWQKREVGDENTAPTPSFLPIKDGEKQGFIRKITGMTWYRNRFVLLADKNICASVAGDYYNFWPKSAMASNEDDPIDIQAAGVFPTPLTQSLETTSGLVLFSKEEQFLFTTDADMLKPGSAKVMSLSSYNCNPNVPPIKMGSNIGFISDAGLNDKFFEMSGVSREGTEPTVVELSKSIEPRLPDNLGLLTHSKSNMTVFLGKFWSPSWLEAPQNTTEVTCEGTETNRWAMYESEHIREVWGYKYYDNGRQRVQSAWFRWVFDWPICYHVALDDNYYHVVHNGGATELRVIGLKHEDDLMAAYLDGHWNQMLPGACFYELNGNTVFPIYSNFHRKNECYYFEMYNMHDAIKEYNCGEEYKPLYSGYSQLYNDKEDCNLKWAVLPGNWLDVCGEEIDPTDPNSPYRLLIGKTFDMVAIFPTIYVTKAEGDKSRSKWDPTLTLHRAKFSVGKPAEYQIHIKRKSREPLVQFHDVDFDYPRQTEEDFTQPIYMRNDDIEMKMVISDTHGGILYSMQWEGDFNAKWYKYV
jgi:hypothetical protein